MATTRDRYLLDVDTRGATRGINGVKAALGGLAGIIAVSELAQLGRSIVGVGLEFEKFETILTTLTGSQQAARRELERLQVLSKQLPQDVADINSAFVILERNGLSTTTESLEALSNVATANGRSLEQVAEATADALTGEFERLKEFGVRVTQEGKQLSVNLGNSFLGSVANGRELIDLLVELGNTEYGGAAEANAQTLDQSLSNLRGAASIASSEFTQGLRPALKEVADEITNVLEQNDQLAKELGADLGDAIKASAEAIKFLVANLDLVKAAASALITVKLVELFAGIKRSIGGAINQLIEFNVEANGAARGLARFGVAGRVLAGLGALFGKLLTFINPVTAAIATAAGLLVYFKDTTVTLGETTSSVGEILLALVSKAKTLATVVGTTVVTAFQNFIDLIAGILEPFRLSFTGALTVIREFVNTGIGRLVGFFDYIVRAVTAVPRLFAQGFSAAGVGIQTFVDQSSTRLQELWDFIKTLGDDPIEGEFQGLFFTIADQVNKIKGIEPVDWDEIMARDFLGEAGDAIKGTIEQIVINHRAAKDALNQNKEAQDDVNESSEDNNKLTDEQIAKQERLLALKRSQQRTDEIIRDINQRTADAIQDKQLEGLRGITRELKEIEVRELRAARASKQRLKDQLEPGQNDAILQGQLQQIDKATRAAIKAQQEATQAAYEQSRQFSTGWERAFDEYQDNATNAAQTAERLFQQTTQSMEDSIVNFAKTGKFEFRDFIDTILEELLRSQIRQLLASTFGALGSGGGGGSSALDTFAGFFANGGTIPSGQFGVVGEKGPELVSGPAQVTPGAGSSNVTYNINAVDAASFKQMVARDPEFIYAVTERGKRSLPQTRR